MREAWRSWRCAPGTAFFCIVSISVGLGSSIVVYSALDAAVFSSPSVSQIHQLVNIYRQDPRHTVVPAAAALFSANEVEALRAEAGLFSSVTAWRSARVNVAHPRVTDRIAVEFVDGDYFRTLGVNTAIGRAVGPSDDSPATAQIAVLSDTAWARWFGKDPAAIGTTIRVSGRVVTIVGVVEPMFRGISAPSVIPTELWLPLSQSDRPANASLDDPSLKVRARLDAAVTPRLASSMVATVGNRINRSVLRTHDELWVAVPTADIYLHESVHAIARPISIALMAMMAVMLAVMCSNVGAVIMARGLARSHQQAVRLSLGASRWHILQSEAVHAAMLLFVAVFGAFLLAAWTIQISLPKLWQLGPGLKVQLLVQPSLKIALIALAASALTLFISGMLPALRLSQVKLSNVLARGNTTVTGVTWRWRGVIIGAQVTVSTVAIVLGGVAAASVYSKAFHDPGFALHQLALVRIALPLNEGSDGLANRDRVDRILRSVRGQIGSDVAVAAGLPVGLVAPSYEIEPVGEANSAPRIARVIGGSPSTLSLLGVAILEGRTLETGDQNRQSPVVVLSRATALALFGTQHVVGRGVTLRSRQTGALKQSTPTYAEVIGIAADTDVIQVGRRTGSLLAYAPIEQHPADEVLLMTTSRDPDMASAKLAELLRVTDPDLAIADYGAAAGLANPVSPPLRVTAILASCIGVLTLLLAMVGLYGAVSLNVSARMTEIGVRMAIGAAPANIVRLILRDGLVSVLLGLIVGIVLAYPLASAAVAITAGTRDVVSPAWLLSVATIVLACGVVACAKPALQAASLNAADVIRRAAQR